MEDNEAREKYTQLKMLDENIQELQKYIQELDQQVGTLQEVINWVKEIQDVKPGSETMIPLANGIFLKGTITDTEKFYVNVGEKTIVPKGPEKTIEMLEMQVETLGKMREQTVLEFQTLLEQAQQIEQEVQERMQ